VGVIVTSGVRPSSLAALAVAISVLFAACAPTQTVESSDRLKTPRASSTTTVASSANPTVAGQTVTFTATVNVVAPDRGVPSGTVTFRAGSTTLGTGTLNAARQATLTTGTLAVDAHALTAHYAGDARFNGSTSAALNQVVTEAYTTTTVASSANPTVAGQTVAFTATVNVVAPGRGVPSGTVTFRYGSLTVGTGTLNAARQATLTTITPAVGTHALIAQYAGDARFNGGTSAAHNQIVTEASTTTTVASSANPAVAGQTVTLTATVNVVAPGSGVPTGPVTFRDGSTTLGTGTLNAARQATLTTSALLAGTHAITVQYGGDRNFTENTSSSPLSQTVASVTVAAVLPLSRSVRVGGAAATAFAAIINAGAVTAVNCAPAPPSSPPAGLGTFTYQTTTPGNLLTGTPNAPASIAPGATQNYVFGFLPTATIPETSLAIRFVCDNVGDASQTPGVNNFLIVADTTPIADTIALMATVSGDGVVRIQGPSATQLFAIGTSNVGATGTIVVSADTGGVTLPLALSVCETTGGSVCLASPTPTVTVNYTAGTNRSFAFFAHASGSIRFDPANNRVFARLTQAGVLRGATSAAVCTTPHAGC
jgi:predicted hotdog family 3-hydroxylacyl-ACP dehydratase